MQFNAARCEDTKPRALQEDLSCPVCQSTFNDGSNAPLLLICGHSCCAVCVPKLPLPIACPLCHMVTPGPCEDLKKTFALIDALPRLQARTPEPDGCGECKSQATEYCGLCGSLCEECSTKLHNYKALSDHKLVPIASKATLQSPVCIEHGKKAFLFRSRDSAFLCALCEEYGDYQDSPYLKGLPRAAAKKVADLRDLIDRANFAQKIEHHTTAIAEAQDAMKEEVCRARAELQQYFEAAKARGEELVRMVDEQEAEMELAFIEQKFELARACSSLKVVAAQAEKVCEQGSKWQILQAPPVEFPSSGMDVLSQPCFSSVKFKLALPDLPSLSMTCDRESCKDKVSIESIAKQDGGWGIDYKAKLVMVWALIVFSVAGCLWGCEAYNHLLFETSARYCAASVGMCFSAGLVLFALCTEHTSANRNK